MELGNELRAGLASLWRFHDLFSQHLPPLYHIKLNTVEVLTHLGENIPVPTIFCSRWKVLLFLLISVDLHMFAI
jgi:hypothetical protein